MAISLAELCVIVLAGQGGLPNIHTKSCINTSQFSHSVGNVTVHQCHHVVTAQYQQSPSSACQCHNTYYIILRWESINACVLTHTTVRNHIRRHEVHYTKMLVTMKDIISRHHYICIRAYMATITLEIIKGHRPVMLYSQSTSYWWQWTHTLRRTLPIWVAENGVNESLTLGCCNPNGYLRCVYLDNLGNPYADVR